MIDHITDFSDALQEGGKVCVAWKRAAMYQLKSVKYQRTHADVALQITKDSSKKIKNYVVFQSVIIRDRTASSVNHTMSSVKHKLCKSQIPQSVQPPTDGEIIQRFEDCVYILESAATGLIITGVGAFILPHMLVGVGINIFVLQQNIRRLRKVVKEVKRRDLELSESDIIFAILAGIITKLAFTAVTFGHDDFLQIAHGYEGMLTSHFGSAVNVLHPHVVAALGHVQNMCGSLPGIDHAQDVLSPDPLAGIEHAQDVLSHGPLAEAANAPNDMMTAVMHAEPSTWGNSGTGILTSVLAFGPAEELNVVTLVLEDPVMKAEMRAKDAVKDVQWTGERWIDAELRGDDSDAPCTGWRWD